MRTVTMKVSPSGELYYRGYQITTSEEACSCGCGSKVVVNTATSVLKNRDDITANKLNHLLEFIDQSYSNNT